MNIIDPHQLWILVAGEVSEIKLRWTIPYERVTLLFDHDHYVPPPLDPPLAIGHKHMQDIHTQKTVINHQDLGWLRSMISCSIVFKYRNTPVCALHSNKKLQL